jgi:hypothetical protein
MLKSSVVHADEFSPLVVFTEEGNSLIANVDSRSTVQDIIAQLLTAMHKVDATHLWCLVDENKDNGTLAKSRNC